MQFLFLLGVLLSQVVADSRDVVKKVVHTPWWPAGSEKTAESVGIISHGFVYMTAMMELNETLQKTALQETWDVRDIAVAGGANLSDLVDCFVNAPEGKADAVKTALMSALPEEVQHSPPSLTVVEMPGEYQFVYNSIMCLANIPDGPERRTWRKDDIYAVSARGLMFFEGSVAKSHVQGAYEETHDILDRMSRLVGPEGGAVAALALVDCSVFVTKISDAPRVRQALKEVVNKKGGVMPALTIVQASLPAKKVLLRCTASMESIPRSISTTDGSLVLTDTFAYVSAQLDRNSTGINALEALGKILTSANLTLKETVTCSFFVKDQQKMFDLFGGFFQIFNQENPPPPTRGEYEAVNECAECQVAAKCIAAVVQPEAAKALVV